MKRPAGDLVEGIRSGREEAIAQLRATFWHDLTALVAGRVPEPATVAETVVESSLTAVVAGIRKGELRDPALLPRYVCRVVRMEIARVNARQNALPTLRECLEQCSPLETDMLYRYYINRQTARRICRELAVTHEQFATLLGRIREAFNRGRMWPDPHARREQGRS